MNRFVANLCIIVLAMIVFLPQTVQAQTIPTFMMSWSATPMPDGMDIDQSGQVLVITEDGTVRAFTGNGALVRTLSGLYPNCVGVSADNAGNVFVADLWAHCIHKLTADGTPIMTWGTLGSGQYQFNHPYNARYSRYNNQLYVSDQFNGRIVRYTTEGVYIGEWGSVGTAPGQFNICSGIGIDPRNGRVVVMENNSTNVVRGQVFTPDGAFLFQFGSGGTGDGQFNHPLNAAVGPDGTIYVADKDNHRVQMFTEAGVYVGQFGSRGTGDGQFRECYAVGVDSDGNVFASDHTGGRIEKFSSIATDVHATTWGKLKSLYR